MTTEAIQAVVDRDEITVSEEGIEGASRVIELAAGRDAFTYDNLLPPDLAAAVELINQEDPADALTATLIFLVGCAGLLKLGNRVKCSARYSVPMNLFIASVGPTGLSKTGHTTKLMMRHQPTSALMPKSITSAWFCSGNTTARPSRERKTGHLGRFRCTRTSSSTRLKLLMFGSPTTRENALGH